MNTTGKIASLGFFLLLVASACFAAAELFEWAFAIGDAEGTVSRGTGIFLFGTLVGAIGLVVAALCAWTRWRVINLIALVSAILVFFMGAYMACAMTLSDWQNAHIGAGQPGLARQIYYTLPPILAIAVGRLSWLRFRDSAKSQNSSHKVP
jgi:hypothetical protein